MEHILKRIKGHAMAAQKVTVKKDMRHAELQSIIDLCDEAALEGRD